MAWWVVLTALVQSTAPDCDVLLMRARTAVERQQSAEALRLLREGRAAPAACGMDVALFYVEGLMAARAAWARGGDAAALAPVLQAARTLEGAGDPSGPAGIASVVLRAAASAAQSERDEMALFLAQALQLERARGAKGLGGAPLLSAHEAAAELWLQVHRYEEAAAAFLTARAYAGDSPRTTIGLARTYARQKRTPDACDEYRRLAAQAAPPGLLAAEAEEASRYLRQQACGPRGPRP